VTLARGFWCAWLGFLLLMAEVGVGEAYGEVFLGLGDEGRRSKAKGSRLIGFR